MEENKENKEIEVIDEKSVEVVDNQAQLPSVDDEAKSIVNDILKTNNVQELENLYAKFSLVNTKKNAMRMVELNEMLDDINEEARQRIKNKADEMGNKDVLDYMNAIQGQIERSQKIVSGIKDINATQINATQTNITVNVDNSEVSKLTRESRDRITDFIASFLNNKEKGEN